MRTVPGGLLTLLNSGPAEMLIADLFTFTLVSGTVLRYTNYDTDLVIGGNTYQNPPPIIERSQVKWSKGVEVDTLDLQISDDGSSLVGQTPILQAFVQRLFDGATIELDRVFASPAAIPSWQGPMVLFTGRVADISSLGRSTMKLTVKSQLELLNLQLPRNLVQPACRWTLFDAGCTLNRATFAVSGAVAAGSNKNVLQTNLTQAGPATPPATAASLTHTTGHFIPAQTYYVVWTIINALGETSFSPESKVTLTINQRLVITSPSNPGGGALGWNAYVGLAPNNEMLQNATPIAFGTNYTAPDYQAGPTEGVAPPTVNQTGYFDLGYIVFTSGPNNGVTRAVDTYLAGGVVTLRVGLPNAPTNGDTFTIYPGCNKSIVTCDKKFSNKANFGGFSFVPSPETAI